MVSIIDEEVKSITREILEDYTRGRDIDKMDDLFDQLDKDMIIQIIQKLLKIIYPGYYRDKTYKIYDVNNYLSLLIEDAMYNLNKQIAFVLKYENHREGKKEEGTESRAREKTVAFFRKSRRSERFWKPICRRPLTATLPPTARTRSYLPILVCWPSPYTALPMSFI